MPITGDDAELAAERIAVGRIRSVHNAELDRLRAMAAGLADEAAVQTEDGIRDLSDPDAESDAAVEAALVRQTSQRAIAAARRVAELESRGQALAFGHITAEDGECLYIGRFTVIDGDDALLVDWRARASIPFYRATPLEPLGMIRRRHLLPGDGITQPADELVGYSDEVFGDELFTAEEEERRGLRGEAALLASVTASTPEQMRSVVATIQAEQDAVIRAPADGPLLVQGGPGTGKTVVALHRAAYLLYDQRSELADSGVLIVGPSLAFLNYIASVLPSLGESGVVSLTVPQLYVGIRRGAAESAELAELKGRAEMAVLLAQAVEDRRRRPREPLRLYYGSSSVVLGVEELTAIFNRASTHRVHNDGAEEFRQAVLSALVDKVSSDTWRVSEDAAQSFRQDPRFKKLLLRHFPPLAPEQALNDLCGSLALLRSAGRETGLGDDAIKLLFRERTAEAELDFKRWSDADVPLLDELLNLLGGTMGQTESERSAARDAADEFELAASSSDIKPISIEPVQRDDHPADTKPGGRAETGNLAQALADVEEEDIDLAPFDTEDFDTGAVGPIDDGLSAEQRAVAHDDRFMWEDLDEEPDDDGVREAELVVEELDMLVSEEPTVVSLAFGQRSWRFGHVIVDEAQDLNPMQWKMILRRARRNSMTIVGDMAQRTLGASGPDRAGFADDTSTDGWSVHLPDELASIDRRDLTINYRSPREINEIASGLLPLVAPGLKPSVSIRESGEAILVHRLEPASRAEDLLECVETELDRLATHGGGRMAVIGLSDDQAVRSVGEVCPAVALLDPTQAKGLEFDVVLVVEPADIVAQEAGLALLYIAVTRATRRLGIAHTKPLPAPLADLVSG